MQSLTTGVNYLLNEQMQSLTTGVNYLLNEQFMVPKAQTWNSEDHISWII
jgi:hypothetical protein